MRYLFRKENNKILVFTRTTLNKYNFLIMADLKIKHVTHAKSNKTTAEGKAKLPTADMLQYGELAINYAKGVEKLSLKKAENEAVTFSSDAQIQGMIQSAQGTITKLEKAQDEVFLNVVEGDLNEETNTITYTLSTEGIASTTDVNNLQTQVDNKVEWVKTNNDTTKPERKSIVLDNHDLLLGVGTDGGQYNLAMVSKWDVADYGSTSLHMNFNSKDRPTVNDKEEVAYISDVNTKADAEHTHSEYEGKQDIITDLTTIRNGASLGATALQPSALEDLDAMFNIGLQSNDGVAVNHVGLELEQKDGKIIKANLLEQDIASAAKVAAIEESISKMDCQL